MKEQLSQEIARAAQQAIADGVLPAAELPSILLEVPPQKEFGDYATNFAMQGARAFRKSPRMIAEALKERMTADWIDRVEIAGPGFLNFYLKSDWVYDLLARALREGESYGNTTFDNAPKVQVEFVSANPTGPLHVGHGRGAAFGSALVNLLRAAGNDVTAEYYINDAGNQINNLALSVDARYKELLGHPSEFPENGYHGADIIETAQQIIDKYGDQYLALSEAERLDVFKPLALKEKLAKLREDLEAFHVPFDVWYSEKTLHEAGAIKETCDVLLGREKMYEADGALWLRSTEYGDDKDRVVIRDNGVPTYLAADIAYHRDKFERGFDRIINIWGADHHGYVCRVKAAASALGYDADKLEVLLLQMVSLYRNGQLVKMSKRTGESVTLAELIEEVGTDAARYFFIMRSIDSQLDFDLDLAKSQSNENPVYYIQYAHARIASIFRQAKEAGIAAGADTDLSVLTEEAEIDLIKKIGEYPEEVVLSAKSYAPQNIARYAHELASLFHTFYNQCRIVGVEPSVSAARLLLVTAVQQTIRHALTILGVSAPEKM